jgi:dienelactone hydrolase
MAMSQLRERIIALLGDFPAHTDPKPEVLERHREHGYVRELIAYHVESHERVRAYLLTPDGLEAPVPGVVAVHQHAGQFYLGKSEPAGLTADPMYHYGKDLCRRGFVVICPDLLCFEDRRPPEFERAESMYLRDEWYERQVATEYLLRGSTLQAKYLHDLGCAVEVLQAQKTVDAERIGAIGHSLGGQETVWLSWYDPRVKVGVCSCGVGTIETILRDRIGHNMPFYVPGLLKVCDLDELIASIAPKPVMLTAGTQDAIFPVDGVRQIAAAAERAYREAGAPGAFTLATFVGGHGLPDEMKRVTYRFLERALRG